MVAAIDHRHCKECGKVCAAGAETCSAACQERRDEKLRTRRLYTGIMYVLIVVLVFILILSFLH